MPPPPDLTAFLYDDAVIRRYEIGLPTESFELLLLDPYQWVEGSLTFEGHTWDRVGVRTKGQNSWQPIDGKPSLKIKMNRYDPDGRFFGLEELTLNAMNDDRSMMHERVGYRVYREHGMAAARAMHATVVLNSEPYGLYTFVETVDELMTERWYDPSGIMFEQWDVDYFDEYVTCPNPLSACFQLEFGDDDRTALQGVANAMEGADPAARIAAAGAYLDYASFLEYWAIGAVVGQFDAYPYSSPGDDCHVYFEPVRARLVYLPHGMDECFQSATHHVTSNARGVLATTCLADPTCTADLTARIWRALETTERIDLVLYHDQVAAQIRDHVVADTNKAHLDDDVWSMQETMRSFITGRRDALTDQLGPE